MAGNNNNNNNNVNGIPGDQQLNEDDLTLMSPTQLVAYIIKVQPGEDPDIVKLLEYGPLFDFASRYKQKYETYRSSAMDDPDKLPLINDDDKLTKDIVQRENVEYYKKFHLQQKANKEKLASRAEIEDEDVEDEDSDIDIINKNKKLNDNNNNNNESKDKESDDDYQKRLRLARKRSLEEMYQRSGIGNMYKDLNIDLNDNEAVERMIRLNESFYGLDKKRRRKEKSKSKVNI